MPIFVVSPPRTEAKDKGIKVIIASAGGAAHLPGMTAAKTVLPVIGVPGVGPHLDGMDSLMSMVQMPRGYPVATVAIGKWGAVNAGLLASQILGLVDSDIQERVEKRRAAVTAEIEAQTFVKTDE